MPRRRPQDSESHAHQFIKNELRIAGWDVRNPERTDTGQVWTESECLYDPAIREALGRDHPENIVRVNNNTLWVIEAKRSHQGLGAALEQSESRARQFQGNSRYSVRFITGVAGNPIDSYLARSRFEARGQFLPVTLNGVEATGLLSQELLWSILDSGNPDVADPVIDEKVFVSRAEHINEILELGAVPPYQRAGVIAALLLAKVSDTGPNIDETNVSVLIGDINSRVESILRAQGKPEFAGYIKINLPSTPDNHHKLRRALVDTLQELNSLNIRSAMNSGEDWLGAFYEVFFKYARWAKSLGIVLTPRHLTHWVAEVLDIQVNDIVYDPTCGTGGFLVAAFDYLKRQATSDQLTRFKQNSVFGIEQDDGIAALAVVNMIFRGDGKNNIQEGNCFAKHLTAHVDSGVPTARYALQESGDKPVTKVMMNPPFALKRSDEKESRFIDQALTQMEHGGLLFSVLPYAVMVKPGAYRYWREHQLLAGNTLLGVVTFPPDVFYPVGVTTVGVFIRKGISHPRGQNVLWIRALQDGLLKSKGKRLPSPRTGNDLETVKDLAKAFVHNPDFPVQTIDQFQRAAPLDGGDDRVELVPEVYLTQPLPTEGDVESEMREAVRNTFAYLVKIDRARVQPNRADAQRTRVPACTKWRVFTAGDVFTVQRGHFHSIADLDPGDYVTISRIGEDNGLVGFKDIPEGASVWPAGTITVSTVTGDAFAQPVSFIATDNVVMCTPKPAFCGFKPSSLVFAAQMLRRVKWRYSYGRQCYQNRFVSTEFTLPVTESGDLNYQYMESVVEGMPYWSYVRESFEI